MNLFLSTLSASPLGIFFSDEGKMIREISFERNDCFIDQLGKFPEISETQKIFYVSGPASFTSLRNMSVFLSTFTEFSEKKLQIFSVPTADFFQMSFPHCPLHILSVGRREGFVFTYHGYEKLKNPQIIEMIKKDSPEVIGGEFSEQFLEQFQKENFDTAFSFPLPQEDFLENLLENQQKFLTEKVEIDYGALPNIG